MPNQPVFSKPGSVSAIGGTPGSCGELGLARHAERAQAPGIDVADGRRDVGHGEGRVAADQRRQRRALALVRHLHRVDASPVSTKFSAARCVCEPMPAWPKVSLPGCALRRVDQILDASCRASSAATTSTCGPETDVGHRDEILLRVVAQLRVDVLVRRHRPSPRGRTACSRRAPRAPLPPRRRRRRRRRGSRSPPSAPTHRVSFWPSSRAEMSVAPPGGNGTMKRTGFCGQAVALDCPCAVEESSEHAARSRRAAAARGHRARFFCQSRQGRNSIMRSAGLRQDALPAAARWPTRRT